MPERDNIQWQHDLQGPDHDQAVLDLIGFLFKGLAAYFEKDARLRRADLHDLAQEAAMRVLNHLSDFRGESRFTTWAMKIAVNHTISQLRRKRWEEVSLDNLIGSRQELSFADLFPGETLSPEKATARKELMRTLETLIQNSLTEKQRTAFLARLGGMPLGEIARRMHTSQNALYKLLHDARVRLKAELVRAGWTLGAVSALFAQSGKREG